MNDEQRRKELRKWAVEQALKLEYRLSDFEDKEKPKEKEKDLLAQVLPNLSYSRRGRAILNTATEIFLFVEHYGTRDLSGYISWSLR